MALAALAVLYAGQGGIAAASEDDRGITFEVVVTEVAAQGTEVAVKVRERVRPHDAVSRLREG